MPFSCKSIRQSGEHRLSKDEFFGIFAQNILMDSAMLRIFQPTFYFVIIFQIMFKVLFN